MAQQVNMQFLYIIQSRVIYNKAHAPFSPPKAFTSTTDARKRPVRAIAALCGQVDDKADAVLEDAFGVNQSHSYPPSPTNPA